MRINKYRKTDRPRAVNRKRHADNAERQRLHVAPQAEALPVR